LDKFKIRMASSFRSRFVSSLFNYLLFPFPSLSQETNTL
jgi:hypothetical protein